MQKRNCGVWSRPRQWRAAVAHGVRAGILTAALLCTMTAAGCAGSRPVLYPNAKLNSVGQAQAEQDINECMALASASGAGSGKAAATAKKTAGAAAVGGAAGAAAGAVRGHAGRGAGTGAAGAAAGTMTRGLLQSREPTNVEKRFVDQCLHDRGYKTIGWQ